MDETQDFVKVADRKDIQPSQMKEVQVDGESICLANVDGKFYAINNICTHEGGPLADGILEGFEVECPWHQSHFDIRTGEVKRSPASEPEPTYEVKVEGENILIRKRSGHSEQVPKEGSGLESVIYNLVLMQKQSYEGTDVMSFKFSKEEQNATPGAKMLDYLAGQFAFFDIGGVYNDPKGPIRHFTLSSSPTEDFIMISTRIRESPYKKRLASLEEGANVKVKGPQGEFTLHEDYSNSAIFISGGIGVTPFRSMIKNATDKNLPLKIVMFNSNRNLQNILFKSDFDDCVTRNKNLSIIYTITEEGQSPGPADWKGEKGKIDKAMLIKYLRADELEKSIFYICGPPVMLKAMQDVLQKDIQIPKDRIKVEEFTGY